MNTVRFVKSFSKGQITIPKQFRDAFGVKDEFWLRLSVQDGKIIAELVEKATSQSNYLKTLMSIKGGWISEEEIKKNRKIMEKQIKKRAL